MQLYERASAESVWALNFTVHGDPKSWKRATPIGLGAVKASKKNTAYQTQVKWSAKAAMTNARVYRTDEPIVMCVTFYFVPPESWPQYKRAQALMNQIACVVRADTDNFVKNIGDGLNEIAYKDDHQIVDIHAYRRWADKPRADVMLVAWRPSAPAQGG